MSDTQAQRFNSGKPKLSLVLEMEEALTGVAKVLEFGAAKYGRANYKLGLPLTEVADSLSRHLTKFLAGEDIDQESGQRHADMIATNGLFLAQFVSTHPHFDDRPIVGGFRKGESIDNLLPTHTGDLMKEPVKNLPTSGRTHAAGDA